MNLKQSWERGICRFCGKPEDVFNRPLNGYATFDAHWDCLEAAGDEQVAAEAMRLADGFTAERIAELQRLIGPESAQATLAAKADKWMDANPSAMALFRRFATEALLAGRRIGIGAIAERVRWECAVQTRGDGFKVNNSFRAYIARRLIAEMPALASIIETRSAGS